MAHYAYKHACHDIDYEKFQQLVEKYKAENNGKYDGDSNYDGDNWYIMAMWIIELRADIEALTKENEALDEYKADIKRLAEALKEATGWNYQRDDLPPNVERKINDCLAEISAKYNLQG